MNVPCDKFYSVEDVMSILGVGRSKAYDVMKKFNEEMEAHGYYTVSGRVSKSYFDSRTMYDPAAKPPWANELKKASGLTSRTGKGAVRMPYYRECPRCGSHLDPGELCDCGEKERPAKKPAGMEKKSIRLSWEVKAPKGRPSPPCPFR